MSRLTPVPPIGCVETLVTSAVAGADGAFPIGCVPLMGWVAPAVVVRLKLLVTFTLLLFLNTGVSPLVRVSDCSELQARRHLQTNGFSFRIQAHAEIHLRIHDRIVGRNPFKLSVGQYFEERVVNV